MTIFWSDVNVDYPGDRTHKCIASSLVSIRGRNCIWDCRTDGLTALRSAVLPSVHIKQDKKKLHETWWYPPETWWYHWWGHLVKTGKVP